jgi:histidinol-phosphate aminotransferase
LKTQGKKWFKRKLERMRLLDSYKIEEAVESVAQRFGISPLEIIKLNSNENFFIPKDKLHAFMKEVTEEYDPRIYPQEEEYKLKEKLSDYLNIPIDRITIGNGSNQLLDWTVRLFLDKSDQALSVAPTFSLFKYRVSFLGAGYLEAPLKKDFALDAERILTMIKPKTRLLYLCSPNNPTANQFGIDEIQFLVEEFPGVVVIDEAYVEFAEYSMAPLLNKFENLIVVRTFSKAFGLAGLRLGYGVANSDIAATVSKKAQLPYPVNPIALRMGLKLLANIDIMKNAVKQLKAERGKLIKELNEINGVKAFDSQTNFVLLQTSKQSNEVYQGLLSRGIFIRNVGKILHLDNCFRATVGLPQMNAKLLKALEEVCGG